MVDESDRPPTFEEFQHALSVVERAKRLFSAGHNGQHGQHDELNHTRRKTDVIVPGAYKDIDKRVAIRLYLEMVDRPVTFLELIAAMRQGGMKLHEKDSEAYRILGIVVSQNAGSSGKRDWPLVFYREGPGDIDDKVGLARWKKGGK